MSLHGDSVLALQPFPALLVDPGRDRITAANALAAALFGGPLEGGSFLARLEDGAADLIVFADAVAHYGQHWTRSLIYQRHDGSRLACETRGSLTDWPEGPRLLISLIDLGEMESHAQAAEAADLLRSGLLEWKRAQAFFSELERQNQLILNAAGEGIYGINADGKTTFVNRAAQEMLGWAAEDLLGRDTHAIIHHHHLDGARYDHRDCPIYHSFRHEMVARVEDEVFWRKDGRPIQVEYVSTPIYDNQVLAGAVVIFRDISERKEGERRLREALAEVDALRTRLEQENAYLLEEITSERAHFDIVGTSPSITRTLAQIELVAPTEANVLITGESGSGKSLTASAVHKASARAKRPLIRLNCAALSHVDVESEIFGHVRRATRGILDDRAGKIELANGGTLLLEDVGELPLEVQGRLLSVLRDQAVVRLGEERQRRVNVRIIASSTRDLAREVAAGRFREDLYFFLNVFPIPLTPLRERREDIPLLVAHFLELACRRLNRPRPVPTQGTIRQLSDYAWPGNLRELENVIERAVIVSTGEKLRVGAIGPRSLPRPETAGAGRLLTEEEMRALERANLVACLRETGGRVSGPGGAADLLGLRPTTLYSRIARAGVTEADWAPPG
ncbi:PAS domain S-box protein [Paroceanicella profunda]|uniref:Nif-specific regulatory protein n=1 Tax=Paroceanicella profunda TaxID=2579971 RepID=A0A5B8FG09_9RHOB|nr:sigma 54-interacting transcriptional regulator [Paroceanicella profunda]QDL90641.1 PAS domain S-box protein [Paroceanicella profunda]